MGMLRLRLVGTKNTDPNGAAPQYGVLIERARDHTFVDFAGWTSATGSGTTPQPPANWAASFSAAPSQPYVQMARLKDSVSASPYLDEVYWLDVDATNFADADYNAYFYGLTTAEMQAMAAVTVFGGDDTNLIVRLKTGTMQVAFNSLSLGLPGSVSGQQTNVKGDVRLEVLPITDWN